MKKQNYNLINFLITLFFIFLPAIVGYYFYLPDWGNDASSTWVYYVGSLGFILYSLMISYLFIYFKVTNIKLLNIILPLILIMSLIFVSWNWHIAIRIVVSFVLVGIAYPINVLISKIDNK